MHEEREHGELADSALAEVSGGDVCTPSNPSGRSQRYWENSPPPSGAEEWVRPGGGYGRATRVMKTFNDTFRGRRRR